MTLVGDRIDPSKAKHSVSAGSVAVTTRRTRRRQPRRSRRTASVATIGLQSAPLSVRLNGTSMRYLEATVALTAMATALLLGAGR